MEHNACIATTKLTDSEIVLSLAFLVNGQQASVDLPLDCNADTIKLVLQIVGKDSWEQVANSYIRVNTEEQDGKMKLTKIGHILSDSWIDLGFKDEEETKEETKEAVEEVTDEGENGDSE